MFLDRGAVVAEWRKINGRWVFTLDAAREYKPFIDHICREIGLNWWIHYGILVTKCSNGRIEIDLSERVLSFKELYKVIKKRTNYFLLIS